ncbi:hypothetical protein LXL04_021433 [Taraxacum kok-saghyz]
MRIWPTSSTPLGQELQEVLGKFIFRLTSSTAVGILPKQALQTKVVHLIGIKGFQMVGLGVEAPSTSFFSTQQRRPALICDRDLFSTGDRDLFSTGDRDQRAPILLQIATSDSSPNRDSGVLICSDFCLFNSSYFRFHFDSSPNRDNLFDSRSLGQQWLKNTHYAVFGLGDSGYQKYNAELQGSRLLSTLRFVELGIVIVRNRTADVRSTSSAAEACRCGPQTADVLASKKQTAP